MGSDNATDLGRRAVACPGWQWMPGMVVLTFDAGHRYASRINDEDCESSIRNRGIDPLPDLTDPATLGCLLALVREAWGDEAMAAWPHPQAGRAKAWRVWRPGLPVAYGPTEAAALVAALEAAPVGAG